MPLLNERATAAVDPVSAARLGAALQSIHSAGAGAGAGAAGAGAADLPASATAPHGARAEAASMGTASSIIAIDGQQIAVPPEVRDAVLDLLQRFAAGHAVVVGQADTLLTTSQAAELIGISATYLLRLANQGIMPVEYRGTHRRFRLADATAYLENSRAAKQAKRADQAQQQGLTERTMEA